MFAQPLTAFEAVSPSASRSASPGAASVAALVSRHSGVPIPLIFCNSRCQVGVARPRQLAMYLTHVVLGQSLTAVGRAFGRDRTTVSYACALIEDMRDDPQFDADVTALELQLQGVGA